VRILATVTASGIACSGSAARSVPLDQADEAKISERLRNLAAKHLTSEEIAAGLADVRRDATGGNRIALMAGQNPHYIAGLFRSDELAKEKKGR